MKPKKTDARFSDTRRIKGSGNVFLDLGFDPAEAKVMALRAEVMIRMEQHLKAQGWTQAEAAKRLGITQPRVSRLIKGQWQDFSLDMLLTLAARAGLEPEVRLVTKNGKTVAELRPRPDDPRDDPEWRAAYERMVELMRAWPDRGYRVGKITEDDRYGEVYEKHGDTPE